MIRRLQQTTAARYVFASIAMMFAAFAAFAVLMLFPLGLDGQTRLNLIRLSLYSIVLFAGIGGIFSIRAAWLRKKYGGNP